jgi:hypothetical protein
MKDIRILKLVLNISVGESGDRLTKAAKVRAEEHLFPSTRARGMERGATRVPTLWCDGGGCTRGRLRAARGVMSTPSRGVGGWLRC